MPPHFRSFCAAGQQTELQLRCQKRYGLLEHKKLSPLLCAQIFHAGEGGVYAELVQDRSFEGLAYAERFLQSSDNTAAVEQPSVADLLDPQLQLTYSEIW